MKRTAILFPLLLAALCVLSGCRSQDSSLCAKPVIYLYPEEETEVTVRLDYDGTLTCTYPAYETECWTVTAAPDGTLTDSAGQTYNYLYWEGVTGAVYDFSKGFCVPGEDTAAFLRRPWPNWGSPGGRPMSSSSTGCPGWSPTPIISSPSNPRPTRTPPA